MADETEPHVNDEHPTSLPEKFTTAEAVASTLRSLFKWGGLVFIAFFAKEAVEALAGQTTGADIGITVRGFASVQISTIVAWVFGVSGLT